MNKPNKVALARRELLHAVGRGMTLVAAAKALSTEARTLPANYQDRRRPRYQANSPEVQNFYRVNRYPAK
jgi:hypothetical protein